MAEASALAQTALALNYMDFVEQDMDFAEGDKDSAVEDTQENVALDKLVEDLVVVNKILCMANCHYSLVDAVDDQSHIPRCLAYHILCKAIRW